MQPKRATGEVAFFPSLLAFFFNPPYCGLMKTDAQTLAETLNKIAFPRERAEAFQRADDISIRTFFHLHSERVYLCRDGSGFIYRGTTSAAGCGHIPNWHTTHELVLAGELPDYIKPIRA